MFGIAHKVTARLKDGGVTVLTPLNGLLHIPGWLVYRGQGAWLLGEILDQVKRYRLDVPKWQVEAIVDQIMKEVEA